MVQGLAFLPSDAGLSFQVTRAETGLLLLLLESQVCVDNFPPKALLPSLAVPALDYMAIPAVNVFGKIAWLQHSK